MDEGIDRNTLIAAHVGSVLLPLAGMVGASLFMAQGKRRTARTVYIASLVGVAAWVLAIVLI